MRAAGSYPHAQFAPGRTPLAVQTRQVAAAIRDLVMAAFIPLGILAAGALWWGH